MQVLADAVEGAKSLHQDKIADWLRGHTFKTVMGDIAFGQDGELSVSHSLMVQFQHVTGNGIDRFNTGAQPVILWPAKYKDGDALYPLRFGADVAATALPHKAVTRSRRRRCRQDWGAG